MPTEATITEACQRGDLPQIQRWGRQGVRAGTWRPLRAAVANSHPDVLRCLVTDLNAADDDFGFTALHLAAMHMGALLQCGAC
jgi:hypothetical protein